MDIHGYDRYLVAASGGKDSVAVFLWLMEQGVDLNRVELHHHLIDGRESPLLMDWAITEDYVRQLSIAFGVPVYFSWKVGGFEAELSRFESLTAPTRFEVPGGSVQQAGGTTGTRSTRLKFPGMTRSTRWCTPYGKIQVMGIAICNQMRFNHARTLVLSGERWAESQQRQSAKPFEVHRADARNGRAQRHVDHLRPLIAETREQVWDRLRRWRINPHPAYRLGWARCSCALCIYSSEDQLASAYAVMPDRVLRLAEKEAALSHTIWYDSRQQRAVSVLERAARGTPYPSITPALIQLATGNCFTEPIILPSDQWLLPYGATNGDESGPT